MKIKIGDEAKRHGFTDEEAARIGKGLSERLKGRFAVTEVAISVDEQNDEVEFQITGSTPEHGDQQFELRVTPGIFEGRDREEILNIIGRSAYECVYRDLERMESGRSLGAPSTKQLEAAREFLFHHLANIEHEWLAAHPEHKTAATPEPLHIHLSNVMAALAPTRVDDAHRQRATELVDSITGEKTCLASLSGKTEHDPNVGAYNIADLHAAVAQAIASAEGRGEQKGREAATA